MNRRNLILLTSAAAVLGIALLLSLDRKNNAPRPACGERTPCDSTVVSPESEAVPPTAPTEGLATEPPESPTTDGVALRDEADRLVRDGKVLEGLEVFRRAVAAEPTAKNHGDLGALLYRLTAFDEAAIHLRAAAELDPTNADRWIALANVYYRKVDPGEAWKAERRAREAEPGLELARDASGKRVRKGDKAPREP